MTTQYNNNEVRKIIKYCDIWMIIAFVLMIAVRAITLFYFSLTSIETGAQIQQIATIYEANPLFASMIQMQKLNVVLKVMIMPSLGAAIYLLFRKRTLNRYLDPDILQLWVNFMVILLAINFTSDLALLAGKLA